MMPHLIFLIWQEKPELLDKLTLCKWLFKARENLRLETYQLLDEWNGCYRNLELPLYQHTSDQVNIHDTEAAFAKDAAAWDTALGHAFLSCHFLFVNPSKPMLPVGWKLRVGLSGMLQRIFFSSVAKFLRTTFTASTCWSYKRKWKKIRCMKYIPWSYFWDVLSHAAANSRQLIGSQISSWSLLHEIKEGMKGVRLKFGGTEQFPDQTTSRSKSWKEYYLTRVWEKVAIVEGGWVEGLVRGAAFGKIKIKFKECLTGNGRLDGTDDAGPFQKLRKKGRIEQYAVCS